MARSRKVTIEGGDVFVVGALTIDQVEEFLEDRPAADDSKGWQKKVFGVIATALNNAKGAVNGEALKASDLSSRLDIPTRDELYRVALDLSGLKVAAAGEAPAAANPESTSSTSAAA